jgi:hypothetical protein
MAVRRFLRWFSRLLPAVRVNDPWTSTTESRERKVSQSIQSPSRPQASMTLQIFRAGRFSAVCAGSCSRNLQRPLKFAKTLACSRHRVWLQIRGKLLDDKGILYHAFRNFHVTILLHFMHVQASLWLIGYISQYKPNEIICKSSCAWLLHDGCSERTLSFGNVVRRGNHGLFSDNPIQNFVRGPLVSWSSQSLPENSHFGARTVIHERAWLKTAIETSCICIQSKCQTSRTVCVRALCSSEILKERHWRTEAVSAVS